MGTTNNKPPGPIIMIDQSENTQPQSGSIFGGSQLCCAIQADIMTFLLTHSSTPTAETGLACPSS